MTVGLNFGSPMSGAGFNVSSTVSQIMANLQNVETPWKNQITSIDSQDTVISSLGSLLSKLSTDMTTLTDGKGILSEKTGSSSNSGVVELTAASNTAIAGTHTVVVSNLAATSSGYLAEITNAKDTLSGSITIQVGSGSVQTITINSSNNTLATLAKSINSAGLGVTAAVLTDASGSRLSLVSGTSGTGGELTINSSISDTAKATASSMSFNDTGNSNLTLASGKLGAVANSDTLSGSVVLQVGSGAAKTIALDGSNNTLGGLMTAINSANLGVTASIVDNGDGTSSISLLSQTSGSALAVTPTLSDTTTSSSLSYAPSADVSLASDTGTLGTVANTSDKLSGSVVLQVGNGTAKTITLTSSNNTLTGLMTAINSANLGVTASIVTNSTTGVSSISLLSQTSGSAGALTVTSSLKDNVPSALGYTKAVSGANASLTVDGVSLTTSSNTVSDLIPGLTFQLLSTSATPVQVVIGNYNSGVETTVNSLVTDYNSLISAMNAQEHLSSSNTVQPLFGSPTLSMLQQNILGGLNHVNPNGYIDAVSNAVGSTLSGSISIQMGTAAAQTFTLSAGDNTVSGLAAAINAKDIGVTASVVTINGQSSLTLASHLAGSAGALIVSSALVESAPTALTYSMQTDASGKLGTLASGKTGDTLSGTLAISFGTNAAQTITLDSSNNTLASLAQYIHTNTSSLGVDAEVKTNSDGSQYIQLISNNGDANGSMTVNANLTDTTTMTNTNLNYNASSDIGGLTGLGISVNTDGTLSLDVNTLDSVLNADYSGVQGFFQNANSWGFTFNRMLTQSGTDSSTGVAALALKANSSIEATLNANISREDALISSESKSLTLELNSANEILQALPSQLSQVNELYSAITGYNQSSS